MIAILVKVVHFIVCIGLIVIVLLQADKGEGLAGAFGGGASSTVFGDRGGGGVMSRMTTAMAVIFMITSLVISIYVPLWEQPMGDSAGFSSSRTPISAPAAELPLPVGIPGGGGEKAPQPVQPPAPVPGN